MDIGGILGGAGSILSGASGIAGLFGKKGTSWKDVKKQVEGQRMIARGQFEDRMELGEKYGIHKLSMLGVPAMGGNINTIGNSGSDTGDALYNMGQGLAGAAQAFSSREEKAIRMRLMQQQIENGDLQNDRLRAEIGLMSPAGRPVIDDPMNRTVIDEGREPGVVSEMSYAQTPSGGYVPVKSKDATDRMEDDMIGNILWSFRNNLLPSIGINANPPKVDLPEGYEWKFNPFTQEYYQARKGSFGIKRR